MTSCLSRKSYRYALWFKIILCVKKHKFRKCNYIHVFGNSFRILLLKEQGSSNWVGVAVTELEWCDNIAGSKLRSAACAFSVDFERETWKWFWKRLRLHKPLLRRVPSCLKEIISVRSSCESWNLRNIYIKCVGFVSIYFSLTFKKGQVLQIFESWWKTALAY